MLVKNFFLLVEIDEKGRFVSMRMEVFSIRGRVINNGTRFELIDNTVW